MVAKAPDLRDAEALIVEMEAAEARGNATFVVERMMALEEAIAFLMGLNFRLAGNDKANALVASLQLRARELRERHKGRAGDR
jgi:BioD-like phosphotransacetylase family protein